ncbi:MAG: GGDEF domain-containing protein [Rhodocyclaceae bacterium]
MTPFEIARETLKRLAQQRITPTPDNYRALYHEIAGTTTQEPFPEKSLRTLLSGLPRTTPEQLRFAHQIEKAIADNDWETMRAALADLLAKSAEEPPNWSGLIRELLLRLEMRQADLTPARKREALEHVLSATSSPKLLYGRLQGLLKNWSQASALEAATGGAQTAIGASSAVPPEPISSGASAAAPGKGTMDLLELLAQLLETTIALVIDGNVELTDQARQLANAARNVRGSDDVASLVAKLKRFAYRLHFVAEDQSEIRASLLHLLHLVIDNIRELVLDDQWLHGQIATVLDLVSQPLDLRRLDEVERRMKEVIYKQSALKKSLTEAQEQLKAMLATFVDRLADFSASTGSYHDKLERCAERIGQASDIAELTQVLDEVMSATRAVQLDARRTHDELQQMRQRVTAAEQEVQRLQQELAQASELVRHDPLTGALNRKGMDEAIETEVSRSRRHGSRLCLALLDIDNFKKLNDSLGHAAGDAALVHLAKVVEETIRPEDTLARYGGEEFVILLPNTALEDAVTAMTRVQRELTRRFFLHDNQKVLITFSCGVAELGADETAQEALERADQAMYLAKRAGKNRVMAG